MIPPRHHRTAFDDVDPDALNVFVPGVMGAGILVSIGLLIGDLARKLGGGRAAERQGALAAGFVVREFAQTVHREDVVARGFGMRSRLTYFITAALLLSVGIYGMIGSFWNFVNPIDQGWAEDVAWIWVLSAAVGTGLVWVGFIALQIAVKWPLVPTSAIALLVKTPLGRTPRDT